jgi:hypothetical protein
MTEQEWLLCSDPWPMLGQIEASGPSPRKTRLWNAAVCRRYWAYIPENSRSLLIESEQIADSGQEPVASMELCGRANAAAYPFDRQYPNKQFPDRETLLQRNSAAAVCYAVSPDELRGAASYFIEIDPKEGRHQAQILRDIFGNPFRPAVFQPAWRTSTAVAIAQQMYDTRDFTAMPILADALQDAGCDNDNVLSHCREATGVHVRGCWVVDLVLSKG